MPLLLLQLVLLLFDLGLPGLLVAALLVLKPVLVQEEVAELVDRHVLAAVDEITDSIHGTYKELKDARNSAQAASSGGAVAIACRSSSVRSTRTFRASRNAGDKVVAEQRRSEAKAARAAEEQPPGGA